MAVSVWILVIMVCISMLLFCRIPETFVVNEDPKEYVTIIPKFLTRAECESLAAAGMKKGLEVSEVGGGTEEDPSKLDLDSRRSRQTWFVDGEHPVSDKLRKKTKEFLSIQSPSIGQYTTEDIQIARYSKGGYYYHHFDGDDCTDDCPNDPDKTAPGACDCGHPDTDTDADGVSDCTDNCPNISNADQADGEEAVIG